MTIQVLAQKGQSKAAIARTLGVTEGTVRYHLKRIASDATDGRADREFAAASVAAVIDHWIQVHQESSDRPPNLKELYEFLVAEHDYAHSYRSIVRFVRSHYPRPKRRTYRRVETPPGAQAQTDWGEYPRVQLISEGEIPLHAFVMVLSHSRKPAVVWSRSEDQLSWLTCHNEALLRLGGVPAVNRIDNLKTGVAHGAGAWGTINATYKTYADMVGFHVDACQPRAANAKGKTEAKVRLTRLRTNPRGVWFEDLKHLQSWTDERLTLWAKSAICPITGLTVEASWERELEALRPLPILPVPFDIAVTRPVRDDCLVSFEARQYTVPFQLAGKVVEVRGCAGTVQILHDGQIVKEYPRGTAERLLIDPSCYEGEETDEVIPPQPLGRMGKHLEKILLQPVEERPLDLYADLVEVAR